MSGPTPITPTPATPGGRSALPRFEPDVFGKYFLLQRMAVGGMAEVLRAKTLGTGGFQKELVVKRILPRLARDRKFARMFVNEAKITVGLTHPNVAQVLELGEVDGSYFMAMELVDGIQLRDLVPLFRGEGARLQADHAVWMVYEALKGLDHAHRATDPLGAPLGIVHCDVSPDNVMVTFDAAVKVVDFGIARAATEVSNAHPGLVMGKVNFLSPEQATGRDVDPRTDVYAAGVVLYHLLTGTYPYGRFQRLEDLAPLVRGDLRYTPARTHDPRLPADLDAILEQAVALPPGRRFPDARSFMMALEETLYPTPHSAISEHLRLEVTRGFADRRDRLARLRANDQTVMRILARRLGDAPEDPSASAPRRADVEALGERRPSLPGATHLKAVLQPRPILGLSPRQLLVSLLLAAGLAGGVEAGRTLLTPAPLVVSTTPPGARVQVDGEPVEGITPLVVEGLARYRDHDVDVALEGYRPWRTTVRPATRGAALVETALRPTHGSVRVESEPRGAAVYLDGERRGRTPMELDDVDLTRPHKLGLKRRGYELDEVVLQDLEPGHTVRRTLQRGR